MARKMNNGKTQNLTSHYNGNHPRMNKDLRSAVKRTNERIRKLETVNKMATQSPAYVGIQRSFMDKNALNNPFYRMVTNKDGSIGIRFILPKDYEKLSALQKKRYEEEVNRFLNNRMTTKIGIEEAQRKSYEEFMKNHPELGWNQDEYEDFFKAYSQMQEDEEAKNAYDRMTQILEEPGEYATDLTEEKIVRILNYNTGDIRYSNRPVIGEFTNRNNIRQ
jgi:hypothetical protein